MNISPPSLKANRLEDDVAQANSHPGAGYCPSNTEDGTGRFGLLHRLGWLPLYPLVLLFTILLKLKNRALATEDRYLEHQVEFFGFSRRLQDLLGREFMPVSDKFHKYRQSLSEYALSGTHGSHARVLDVATGCGFQAKALKAAGASEVLAIDYVQERLDEARRVCAGDGITFVRMDAARLAFPDAAFHATVVSCALHDMPKGIKTRAIAEMVRVTLPGGNVVIFEPRTIRSPLLGSVLGLVGEALDESINMRDYIMDDLNPILAEQGLELVEEQNVFVFGILNIKLCRRSDLAGSAD